MIKLIIIVSLLTINQAQYTTDKTTVAAAVKTASTGRTKSDETVVSTEEIRTTDEVNYDGTTEGPTKWTRTTDEMDHYGTTEHSTDETTSSEETVSMTATQEEVSTTSEQPVVSDSSDRIGRQETNTGNTKAPNGDDAGNDVNKQTELENLLKEKEEKDAANHASNRFGLGNLAIGVVIFQLVNHLLVV